MKLFKITNTYLFISLIVIIGLTIITFYRLPQTYFQQDEWYGFGQAISMSKTGFGQSLQVLGGYHFTPLSVILFFVQFYLFGLQSNYYAYVSILLHLMVGLCIYGIMLKIYKNVFISTISSVIFLLANSLSQGVTWFAANLAVEFTAIFSLLSLNSFIDYYHNKKTWSFYLSIIFVYLGLLCKEDILASVIVYVIFFFFIGKKYKIALSYIIGILPYIIFRLLFQYHAYIVGSSAVSTATIFSWSILLRNFSILLSGIGEAILSPYVLRSKLEVILAGYLQYGVLPDDFIIKVLIPIIGFIVTLILLSLSFLVYRKYGGDKDIKYLPLFLLGSVISFIPYVFLGRDVVWLESRYFYLPMIWISFLLGFLFLKSNKQQKLIYSVFILVVLYENVIFTRNSIASYLPLSETRRRTVDEIKKNLVRSDNIVYYIQNGENLPFQSGKGQTLLVLHAMQNPNLAPLLKDYFLWNLGSEGYKNTGKYGFGYYYNSNSFVAFMKKNSVGAKCFYYDSKKTLIINKDCHEYLL